MTIELTVVSYVCSPSIVIDIFKASCTVSLGGWFNLNKKPWPSDSLPDPKFRNDSIERPEALKDSPTKIMLLILASLG